MKRLEVAIPDRSAFYTLYAEGPHSWKTYDRLRRATLLHYPPGAAVFLYYTYPTHREACVIRHNAAGNGGLLMPGLDGKVSCLFRVHASRVDKLRRAVFYLNKHSSAGAYNHDDGFYIRLGCLLERRGKLNYAALAALAENSLKEIQYRLF